MASPTIDGHATGVASTGANATATLTTTNANDIIVVQIYNENHTGTASAVTSVSATGLTFAKRATSNGSTTGSMEIWWALSTLALTAAVITVVFTSTYDDCDVIAFGVSGCNTSTPWDANVSLPAHASFNTGPTTPAVSGVSTSSADDLLLAFVGAIGGASGNPPSGWTNLTVSSNGGGTLGSSADISYKSVSSTQSGITVTSTDSIAFAFGNPAGEMIVDALTSDAGAPPTTGEASQTMLEGIAADTPKGNVAQAIAEATAHNPNPLAMPGQTIIEAVAQNPAKVARPSLTMFEVLWVGMGGGSGAGGSTGGAVTVDVINNVPILLGIGNDAVIYNNRLSATSPQVSDPASIVYQLVTPPANGFLAVNGKPVTTWTQADINNGLLIYHATDVSYGYFYEAGDTILFTGEVPEREQAANSIAYVTVGLAGDTDSFTFTFPGATTVVPTAPVQFNATMINTGFVPSSVLAGEDGLLSTAVVEEQVSTVAVNEALET